MPIDSFTVLLFGLFIKLVLGALFVVFWLENRAAPWFGWWSACLLLGSVASVLYMFRGPDSLVSVGIGNAALIASFACCWQGARAFDRRRPLWSPVVLAPCMWLGVSLLPSFMANVPFRIVLSSALIAPLLVMSAVEFWRGRAERLPSRWPVIVIFAVVRAVLCRPHADDRSWRRFRSARCRWSPAGSAPSTWRCSPTPSCCRCCWCRCRRSASSSTSAPRRRPIR